MRWLRAKRRWRKDKPDIFKYLTPITVGGETFYGSASGAAQEYVNAYVQWLLDEPKFFLTILRRDLT